MYYSIEQIIQDLYYLLSQNEEREKNFLQMYVFNKDLSIYANAIGGTVSHYRDNAGLECDAVLHLDDGRWGAIEIKLGGDDLVESGASSLKTLKNKIIEKSDEKAPSFLMVLTAVGGAYQRKDGVYVAPINLLKP